MALASRGGDSDWALNAKDRGSGSGVARSDVPAAGLNYLIRGTPYTLAGCAATPHFGTSFFDAEDAYHADTRRRAGLRRDPCSVRELASRWRAVSPGPGSRAVSCRHIPSWNRPRRCSSGTSSRTASSYAPGMLVAASTNPSQAEPFLHLVGHRPGVAAKHHVLLDRAAARDVDEIISRRLRVAWHSHDAIRRTRAGARRLCGRDRRGWACPSWPDKAWAVSGELVAATGGAGRTVFY